MSIIYKTMLGTDAVVSVIDSTNIVSAAAKIHKMSRTATAALGRTLTVTALMGSALKGKGDSLSVTINGGGGLGKITTAANSESVRGFVENPLFDCEPKADGHLNVGLAVGTEGNLTVIKDIGLKEPYVGKTQLVTGEIAEDFAYYFTVSEQSPSALALGVLVKGDESGVANKVVASGGILVQPLPGCSDAGMVMLEDIVRNFTNVSDLIKKNTPQEIIDYYFGAAFELKNLAPSTVVYKCNCSKQKIDGVIKGLGYNEAKDIVKTQGCIEVKCEFCETEYKYDDNDVDVLFNKVK